MLHFPKKINFINTFEVGARTTLVKESTYPASSYTLLSLNSYGDAWVITCPKNMIVDLISEKYYIKSLILVRYLDKKLMN